MAIIDKLNLNKVSIKTRKYKAGSIKVVNVPMKRSLTDDEAKELRDELIKKEMLSNDDSSKIVVSGHPVKGTFYLHEQS